MRDFAWEVLTSMGIDHLAEKSYLNISGGERQQLLVTRAIVQEPALWFLLMNLQRIYYGNQHKVLKRIKEMSEAGFSVIITSHNPDHALLIGDKVAIVDKQGRIVRGIARAS